MAYDENGNYVSAKNLGKGDWQRIAYENLANAIIVRACNDYLELASKESTLNTNGRVFKKEIANFFKSQWFHELTNVDPNYLIKILDKQIKEGYIPKWSRNREEEDIDA